MPVTCSTEKGANLNMEWSTLRNVEFFADDENNRLYSTNLDGRCAII